MSVFVADEIGRPVIEMLDTLPEACGQEAVRTPARHELVIVPLQHAKGAP